MIVGQAPQPDVVSDPVAASAKNPTPQEQLLTLSAQAPSALQELATRYATMLDSEDTLDNTHSSQCAFDLNQLAFSAATGRSHLTHRAAFVADSRQSLVSSLTQFAAGEISGAAATGSIGRRAPKLVFLFTGQGAQHVGMGKELYVNNPNFRAWMDRCATLLKPHLDRHLLDVIWTGEELHQTAYTQPALFAIEFSLAKTFEEWGVTPDLLLGHSIGEYAAACIAGVFSLEDALRLVAARGRLMQSLPAGGQMVSAATDEKTVRNAIGDTPLVSIAAVNAASSIVFSGDGKSVEAVVDNLTQQGIKTTALNVSHAFHSPMMDPILAEFRSIAASVDFQPPNKTIISNVTGEPWDEVQLTADYWVEQLRGAVRFADGIAYAQSKKFQTFVEIGPRPTLTGLGRASVPADYGTWLPGLRPDEEWPTLLRTLAELYVRGVTIDWQRFFANFEGNRVQLPNYPWRHQRCWTDVVSTGGNGQRLHPLVHRRIENASDSFIFESTLSAANPAYLDDHRVFGSVVFPASAFFEMAMVVGRTIFQQREVALINVSIGRALLLSDEPVTVQMIATPNADRFDFEICSRVQEGSDWAWVQHTTGTLERRLPSPAASIDIEDTLAQFTESVDIGELSERFEARGLEYFPRFRAIEAIHKPASSSDQDSGSAFARIKLPTEANLPGDSYRLHPVITDASFRIAEAIFPDQDLEQIHLPFGISGFSCDHAASDTVWVKATARQQAQTRVVDIELFDDDGERVATVEQLTLRSVPVFSLKRAMTNPRATSDVLNEWLYQFAWEETEDTSKQPILTDGDWLVLQDASCLSGNLVQKMQEQGLRVHTAANPSEVDALIRSGAAKFLTGIAHLWGMDASQAEPDASLLASLNVVQSLSQAGVTGRHWFITKGAQAVKEDDLVSPWQTRFWGLARTLQVEHPDQLGGCIDIDPSTP